MSQRNRLNLNLCYRKEAHRLPGRFRSAPLQNHGQFNMVHHTHSATGRLVDQSNEIFRLRLIQNDRH